MQKQSLLSHELESYFFPNEEDFPLSYGGWHNVFPRTTEITVLHYHNVMELGYCHEGSGKININGDLHSFSKGDISIIFKNQLHFPKSDKENPSTWSFICLDPVKLLKDIGIEELSYIVELSTSGYQNKHIYSQKEYPELNQCFLQILNELEHKKNHYKTAVKSLIWNFFILFGRASEEYVEKSVDESCKESLLKIIPALNYISTFYMKPTSVDALAQKCNLSTSHFRKLFKQAIGVSPLEYMLQTKIKMASLLLRDTNMSVLDISFEVGFESLSSFNRHFRAYMRTTPTAFRKKQNGQDI